MKAASLLIRDIHTLLPMDAGDQVLHDAFLYIDRIVVGRAYQRAGLGAALYADLLEFAAQRGVERLVCEVDIEPLNVASDAFHRRRGFVEVGTQWLALGTKRVSLREYLLG